MGTGRKLNKAPMTRPRKKARERRRREQEHRKRLIALGVPEEELRTMTSQGIRTLLKRPAKLAQ